MFDIRGVCSIGPPILCVVCSAYVVFVEYICGGSETRGKSLPQLFNYFLYRK